MEDKNKLNILNEYSKIQQGSLVGKGNEVLTKAENINDDNEKFTDLLDSPPLDEVAHGEHYGDKEYHGI